MSWALSKLVPRSAPAVLLVLTLATVVAFAAVSHLVNRYNANQQARRSMPEYESEGFDPPAPFARAAVAGTGQTIADVRMLLDTGADVSLIPRAIAEELGVAVRPSGSLLQTYDGNQTRAVVADVSVEVGPYRFHGTFVVTEAD